MAWIALLLALAPSDDRLESIALRAPVSAVASALLIVPEDSAPLIVSAIRL
ncbi:hypothetical protein ACRAWG_05680 [Methylobacterium sp. P31]